MENYTSLLNAEYARSLYYQPG